MSDLTMGIIIVIATVLFVALIFILVAAQKRKRISALRGLASLNGWSFETVEDNNASGWRLRKGEWILEALNQSTKSSSENSTTVNSTTRWFSDAMRMPDGIVLIGPHQPEINFGGLGEVVKMVALRLMVGSEFDSAIGIERVELGSLELMAKYMVWTNREERAKKFLDETLENALRAWPLKMPPLVKFSPAGLEIKIQGQRLFKEQDIYALIKLGSTALDSAFSTVKD